MAPQKGIDLGKLRIPGGDIVELIASALGAGSYPKQERTPRRLVPLSSARNDSLLLEIPDNEGGVQQYAHLLREVDIPKVQAVVSRLQGRGLVVLLAGGVVDNAILHGRPQTYRDIDLIATGYKKAVVGTAHELDNCHKNPTWDGFNSPFDYDAWAFVEGERVPLAVEFSVRNTSKGGSEYVEMPIGGGKRAREGFHQTYSVQVLEPAGTRVAPIDLSLVERRVFEGKTCESYKLPLGKPGKVASAKSGPNAGHTIITNGP